ncbi:MAG TPA: allantoinase AllB [Pyrinomonadaceae bacterium]|jgi:allantoinase|nr:allantoinase AllB [Pyrinomonadaceae bacterium]
MPSPQSPRFIIRARRVVTPEGCGPAAVHVRDGVIDAVSAFDDVPRGVALVEAGESVLMPGLVDSHVHVNEPGRTDWEGFETATRAAAAGGVTTIVDMPLNSRPPTTTLEAFHAKLDAAHGKCHVDVGFWGGVVPGNLPELARLLEAGVVGFKCFLIESGVEEFPHVTEDDLRPALHELKRLGTTLIVHAELPGPIERALETLESAPGERDSRRYAEFLHSRPRAAENEAVDLMIRLCLETGARVHVVHHSSADALPQLRRAKSDGLPVTLETCPHYLSFVAEEIPDGATEFKCCPPIRERENCEELWSALDEGLIDMVVSDHSPCPPALKLREEGDFLRAWGGISSLQLRLPVMWTHARERGHSLNRLAEWLARAPARLAGLGEKKGAIAEGFDADIVVWNPEQTFRVEPSMLHHRHRLTPYEGRRLSGVVETTYLRGEAIYDRGSFSIKPKGALLKRGKL